MGALDEIRKRKNELQQQIEREGKEALKTVFLEMFQSCPEVLAVRWSQYTPYFNDGDPCVFMALDFRYELAGAVAPKYGSDGDDDEPKSYELYSLRNNDAFRSLSARLKRFEKESRDQEVMRSVFGDHVRVTATRLGFEVEEYEHD